MPLWGPRGAKPPGRNWIFTLLQLKNWPLLDWSWLKSCCNSKSQRNLFLDSRSTASTAVSLSTDVRNLHEHDAIVDFSQASFTQALTHWELFPLAYIRFHFNFCVYFYNYNLQVLFLWFRESFSEASENLGQTIMKETCLSENLSLKICRTNSKPMQW